MVICLKKTKTDQEGDNATTGFHVFANPQNPHLCPVLALGAYLLLNPGLLSEPGGKLFPSTNQYSRYSKILGMVVKENLEAFKRIGVARWRV